ncbi:MAG: gfo/Idh/MocA family oxidoreductase [Armatimonadia bacterium]|nr:gfo/Idh/MocA family oxidoreductase [Armatimonadia bacterium]
MDRVKTGIIGCGNISGIYLTADQRFEILQTVAVADMDMDRAQAKAEEHGAAKAVSVDDLLADPEIQIVMNLTPPFAHEEVDLRILAAGKHAYTEKPLGVDRDEGRRQVEKADEEGLLLGAAPDTFLGGGLQTCRKLIDDGAIGKPIGCAAWMMCRGHEGWHPDPEFYYMRGGGPLLDMGPYYLTALVSLLGPVKSVTGSSTISFPERTITSQPKSGTKISVECPTHVNGLLEFQSGAIGNIVMSFDTWAAEVPRIEIYGTDGTLSVPDPNSFGGPVRLFAPSTGGWEEMPLTHCYTDNSRGIGVADMAYALKNGRPHRASGQLAFHVLDAMMGIYDAWERRGYVNLESTCQRPEALPPDGLSE